MGSRGLNDRDLQQRKAELRRVIREKLARMSAEARGHASRKACELLQQQGIWARARTILFYAPLAGELDVWPLLEAALQVGKTAALPRYVAERQQYIACELSDPRTQLRTGNFGIREPLESCQELELKKLDFVLAPGVAFDLHGRRLGQGKGFYDQWLCAVRGQTCGVAFDEQIVGEVPVEPHDLSLDCILTPTRWLELNRRGVVE